jgi:hypothetical protein
VIKNVVVVQAGVNPNAYHDQPHARGTSGYILSPSSMKKFADCPEEWIADGEEIKYLRERIAKTEDMDLRKKYKSRLSELEGPSKAQGWGKLLDCLLLTPQHFDVSFKIRPDTYEKEVLQCPNCDSITESKKCAKCKIDREPVVIEKNWSAQSDDCQKLVEIWEAQGKEVIHPFTYEMAQRAVARLKQKPDCAKAIACSQTQVHLRGEWHDRPTGLVVPVQCLIDLAPAATTEYVPGVEFAWPTYLGDLKESVSISDEGISKQSEKFGWYIQAGFDLDMWNTAAKIEPELGERTGWFFIGQRSYRSFQPFRKILSEGDVNTGRLAYQRILSNYCQCLKHGKWPDADVGQDPEYFFGFGLCQMKDFVGEREMKAARFDFNPDSESEGETLEEENENDFTP